MTVLLLFLAIQSGFKAKSIYVKESEKLAAETKKEEEGKKEEDKPADKE